MFAATEAEKATALAVGDFSAYSDCYKDAHGFRPRAIPAWTSTADYLADMDRLQVEIWTTEADARFWEADAEAEEAEFAAMRAEWEAEDAAKRQAEAEAFEDATLAALEKATGARRTVRL